MKNKAVDYIRSMFSVEKITRKVVMSLLSVVLMGFGIALFSISKMGVDPYTAMNMGIAYKIGIPFGVWLLFINTFIILFVIAFAHRGLIGIGTVLNMTGVGFSCDLFLKIFSPVFKISNTFESILLMSVGLVILCFAASLFFTANIGVGAYDTIGFMLERKTGIGYKWCRMFTDFVVIALAFLVSGTDNMGVGTFITAFCMGPLISFFNRTASNKILTFDYSAASKKFLTAYIKGQVYTYADSSLLYNETK